MMAPGAVTGWNGFSVHLNEMLGLKLNARLGIAGNSTLLHNAPSVLTPEDPLPIPDLRRRVLRGGLHVV